MAVTTQGAVDGYRDKAVRIASVEQFEVGNMLVSITGQVFRWARQSNLSGGVSLRRADGWNLKNHSRLKVAGHLREKTHSSVFREGEERGMCSAALREWVRVVKDQIEERSVVIFVLKKESTIWREASVKNLLREKQLKYIDIEKMRVVTKDRHAAEQIKRDKVESVVTNGSKFGKLAENTM